MTEEEYELVRRLRAKMVKGVEPLSPYKLTAKEHDELYRSPFYKVRQRELGLRVIEGGKR